MADPSTVAQLDSLTALVEKGFAAVADDITGLKTEMRSHLLALAEDIKEIKAELRDIKVPINSGSSIVPLNSEALAE